MKGYATLLLIGAVLFGISHCAREREIAHAPGVLVGEPPTQSDINDNESIIHGEYELTPRADFELRARVLGREDYRFDAGASLSPIDLALGWGRMSDTAILDQMEFSQSVRFFSYRWRNEPPIPTAEIVQSASNMHLIPADKSVERQLSRVRVGSVISLSGRLVDAKRADGWRWSTSLSRTDSGAGACELFLVTAIENVL